MQSLAIVEFMADVLEADFMSRKDDCDVISFKPIVGPHMLPRLIEFISVFAMLRFFWTDEEAIVLLWISFKFRLQTITQLTKNFCY